MTMCAPQAVRLVCRQCFSPASKRLFTSSSSRRKHGHLVNFPPTSSPELDAILSNFRDNIFLPAHLGTVHRNLIYKETLQPYLTGEDPFTVEVQTRLPSKPGQETKSSHNIPLPPPTPIDPNPGLYTKDRVTVALAPINRFRDEPRTKPAFNKMLSLMQTPEDFSLLPEFCRELSVSGRKVTVPMLAKAVRKAADAGQMGVVIELFRRIEKTGLQIGHAEIAREVMRGAVLRALKGEWDEVALRKAMGNADMALRLMEEPRHVVLTEPIKVTKLPDVVGVVMALAAVRAVKFDGGADMKGVVEKWAKQTLECKNNADLTIDENRWVDGNVSLMQWAPIWMGAKLAVRVLGERSEISEKLHAWSNEIEGLLEKAKVMVEANPKRDGYRRGLKLYEDLAKVLE